MRPLRVEQRMRIEKTSELQFYVRLVVVVGGVKGDCLTRELGL